MPPRLPSRAPSSPTAGEPANTVGLASAKASVGSTAATPRGCSNFRLRQADRVVSRFYDGYVQPRTGLKTSQYSLLSHIAALGPVQPAALAQRMGLEPSTLTRNLQPLITQGWVSMGPGTDGRSRSISLTEAGLVKRTEAQRAWKAAQLAFNDRLGAERVAQLHALLDDCLQLLATEPAHEPHPEDDDHV